MAVDTDAHLGPFDLVTLAVPRLSVGPWNLRGGSSPRRMLRGQGSECHTTRGPQTRGLGTARIALTNRVVHRSARRSAVRCVQTHEPCARVLPAPRRVVGEDQVHAGANRRGEDVQP
jgi:hypothetical protein